MKVTVIGAGNMGGAIALGAVAKGAIIGGDMCVTAHSQDTITRISTLEPSIRCTTDNIEGVKGADLIILAIKPWILEEVINQIKGELDYNTQSIASVVAGVDFNTLTTMLDNNSGIEPTIYRVMPNTAISLGRSVTYISSCRATKEQEQGFKAIFDTLGESFIIEESMMSAGTSLASCGIAFALRYLDASISGGVELGFSPEEARNMVIGTMEGALELLKHNKTMPQTEIDKVTTKGGITIKGLEAMKAAGFENAVNEGLKKSR